MIRTVVSGAGGRLGRRVVERMQRAEGLDLVAALVRPGSSVEGQPVAPGSSLAFTSDLSVIDANTVLVEVATRSAALEHVEVASQVGARAVVATTGFEPQEQSYLRKKGEAIAVLLAPNLSMGIAVLLDLVNRASKALSGYDVEVLELHHNKKRDAPSGTAWALGAAAAEARGQDIERDAICARAGDIGARGRQEIGMMSIRGGDIIGEHTVYLAGPTDRLELTHKAATRDAFAEGAVEAARFMGAPERGPGVYSIRHVLGLDPLPEAR